MPKGLGGFSEGDAEGGGDVETFEETKHDYAIN